MLRRIAHPTTWRACKSRTAATDTQPSAVHRAVMSPAQTVVDCSPSNGRASSFGATASPWRRSVVTDRDARLWHHPPRVVPSDRQAISLERLRPAPTPRTRPRLGVKRSHTGQQGCRLMSPRWGSLAVGIGVQAAATDVQHRTPHGHRPGLLVRHDEGISHVDSLATKPRAVLNISRAIRKRLCSSRHRSTSSWSSKTRP
jgi:hypothetical protein